MENKDKAIAIPCGKMCGYNCSDNGGCAYWNRFKKDNNGRQYCEWYERYFYPHERQGCLSYK